MGGFKIKISHHFAISQNYSPNCGVPFCHPHYPRGSGARSGGVSDLPNFPGVSGVLKKPQLPLVRSIPARWGRSRNRD